MLSLDNRPAEIGGHINTRGELHGEETVTALDIPLSGIMLNEQQVNALTQDPFAFAFMFNARAGDKLPEPNGAKWWKPCFALIEKIEAANVTIVHGVSSETIRLVNVKIAKMKLHPKLGGMVELTCTIQCTPDLNESVSKLLGRLNSTVDISIDGGQFGKQQDLPLNSVGAGEKSTPSVDPKAPVQTSFTDADPLLEDARKIVIATNIATVTILEVQLKIDFARAKKLLEALEAEGLVSSPDASGVRHVQPGGIPVELQAAADAQQAEAAGDDDEDEDDTDFGNGDELDVTDDEHDDAA